jgi:hypothetical protein
LPVLLDSYVIDDYERELDVKNGVIKRGEKIACHKGCSICCTIHEIPITTPEFLGISWYYSEICVTFPPKTVPLVIRVPA